MTLSNYRVGAVVAVSDMKLARDFYEKKLGLAAQGDDPDGGRTYQCGEQTMLHIFPSPPGAGKSHTTVAGWYVNDVRFERYDQAQIATDEKGIAVLGTSKGAWFKDPDGNTLGLLQD